jgi:hypothetical protein
MHTVHMIYNWAQYEGFLTWATPDLPQCNIFLFQGTGTAMESFL